MGDFAYASDPETGESGPREVIDDGDRLLTADGDEATVEGLDWTTLHTAAAYDLTIDDLHTFYVAAGDEAVLVHNCGDYLINKAFKAPTQVTPGTRTLCGEYSNDIGPALFASWPT